MGNAIVLLVISLIVAAVTWFVGVGLFNHFTGEPDLRLCPNFKLTSVVCIGMAGLSGTLPFPQDYLFTLFFWAVLPGHLLKLSGMNGMRLFMILAAVSLVSTLALIGAGKP